LHDAIKAFKSAPLIHKWFARRRPEPVRLALDLLLSASGSGTVTTILDPFAGAGSLGLEVRRRGLSYIGVEINPVAALIASYTTGASQADNMESWLEEFEATSAESIKTEYSSGRNGQIITAFHSRVLHCKCSAEIELHHSWLLARHKQANWAVYLCPTCGEVFRSTVRVKPTCPSCEKRFDYRKGTINQSIVKCRKCKQATHILDLTDVKANPRHKLVAIEVYEDGERRYRNPTSSDVERVEGTNLPPGFEEDLLSRFIPVEERFDPRPVSHGFRTYGELFTKRQIRSLGIIAGAIRSTENEELRGALALALSDAAGSNNLLCRYAADWRKLTPAFGIHGYHPVSRPVEGNVWGADLGRGSFRNCVAKAARAYRDLNTAFSPKSDARIICGDSANLPLPDASVDAIFTDPPYFDFLDYADLADFYYQWLRLCLPDNPWFVEDSARLPGDISRMRGTNHDEAFGSGLAKIFLECLRVLKPGGAVAFSFHHSSSNGWWQLLCALKTSGLVVQKVLLVKSELDNGFHSSPGNIKTDAIFLCFQEGFGPESVMEIGTAGDDLNVAVYGYASAVGVLSRYAKLSSRAELEKLSKAFSSNHPKSLKAKVLSLGRIQD
jgi:putative DNA methylase